MYSYIWRQNPKIGTFKKKFLTPVIVERVLLCVHELGEESVEKRSVLSLGQGPLSMWPILYILMN